MCSPKVNRPSAESVSVHDKTHPLLPPKTRWVIFNHNSPTMAISQNTVSFGGKPNSSGTATPRLHMGSRVGTGRRAKPTNKHSWETASTTNVIPSLYPLSVPLWTTHPERWCSGDPNCKEIPSNSYCGIPITLLMGEFFIKQKLGSKHLSPISWLGLTWPVPWVNAQYHSKPSHSLGSSRGNQTQDSYGPIFIVRGEWTLSGEYLRI